MMYSPDDPSLEDERCQENFEIAMRALDLEGVRAAVEAGADVNKGFLAIEYAMDRNAADLAKYLIDVGANKEIATMGATPLFYAIQEDQIEIAQYLINAGANQNARHIGLTLLHWSVFYGRAEIVEMLLLSGVDVNAKIIDPREHDPTSDWLKTLVDIESTALHLACMDKTAEFSSFRITPNRLIIQLLLSWQPDLTLRNQAGQSVLECIQTASNPVVKEAVKDFYRDKMGLIAFFQGKRPGQTSYVNWLPIEVVDEILRFVKPSYKPDFLWEEDILAANQQVLQFSQPQEQLASASVPSLGDGEYNLNANNSLHNTGGARYSR